MKSLKVQLENEELDFFDIGGNRIEGTYFKELIILVDDLGWCKSNVIEYDSIEKNKQTNYNMIKN